MDPRHWSWSSAERYGFWGLTDSPVPSACVQCSESLSEQVPQPHDKPLFVLNRVHHGPGVLGAVGSSCPLQGGAAIADLVEWGTEDRAVWSQPWGQSCCSHELGITMHFILFIIIFANIRFINLLCKPLSILL